MSNRSARTAAFLACLDTSLSSSPSASTREAWAIPPYNLATSDTLPASDTRCNIPPDGHQSDPDEASHVISDFVTFLDKTRAIFEPDHLEKDDPTTVRGRLRQIWRKTLWKGFSEEELRALRTVSQRLRNDFSQGKGSIQSHSDFENGVAKQESFRFQEFKIPPVIPTGLADTPCSKFSAAQILLCLNTLLNTLYDDSNPHLFDTLDSYIRDQDADFGTAFAQLRPQWRVGNFSNFRKRIQHAAERFDSCRESLMKDNTIVSTDVPPRRLWDIFSNRVVHASVTAQDDPDWAALAYIFGHRAFDGPVPIQGKPGDHHSRCIPGEQLKCSVGRWDAISHSWVSPAERSLVSSKVNGSEWRVPLPQDTSLERVRIEVLNLPKTSSEGYVWLDVLCLRQEDGRAKGERLRRDEHAIDVPTIGSIYQHCDTVIQYLCGLGRPFTCGNEDGERHWLNRAWTLQEMVEESRAVTAGITSDSPPPYHPPIPFRADRRRYSQPVDLVIEMRKRFSTNPVDAIGGLLYPLNASRVYAYHSDEPIENAWSRLLALVDPFVVMSITLSFPHAGKGKSLFLPTWDQIKRLSESEFRRLDLLPPSGRLLTKPYYDYINGLTFSSIQGRFQGTFVLIEDCDITDDGTITFKGERGMLMTKRCLLSKGLRAGRYAVVLLSKKYRPCRLNGFGPPNDRLEHLNAAALIGDWNHTTQSFSKATSIIIWGLDIFGKFPSYFMTFL